MQVPFLDLKAQYAQIKEEIKPALEEIYESQMLCLGQAVSEFEARAAQYCGAEHAIGVSSGSDALLVSLMAMGVGSGDEVITPAFTFFSTAGSAARLGARPVFVDIDPETFNIDTKAIESSITEKTKAIIPVHLYGQSCRMEEIMAVAKAHGIAVIEDACQSIGAARGDRKVGTFGTTGCFSFYPTKNLGAFGDAGLVVTNDGELAQKIRILRDHGQNPRYYYGMIGGNFRMDAIQGAVLGVKLGYLEGWTEKRKENAEFYDRTLEQAEVRTPRIDKGNTHIYHQYTIKSNRRDELKAFLTERGVASAVFYPKPLHLQEAFRELGYKEGDLPVTEGICRQVLSLPVYPELTEGQLEYVAESVVAFFEQEGKG